MLRSIAVLIAILFASAAAAQQAGSQIRATPQVPQPMDPASTEASSAPTTKADACDRMQGDVRKRCLQQQRAQKGEQRSEQRPGPGATGMGSGAGASASGAGGATPR